MIVRTRQLLAALLLPPAVIVSLGLAIACEADAALSVRLLPWLLLTLGALIWGAWRSCRA